MDITIYRYVIREWTRDELREVTEAEAATLDDTNWWGGVFDFDTYLSESLLVGTITKVDDEDD